MDRFYYQTAYRIVLPAVSVVSRILPERALAAAARKAAEREERARYRDETVRVGILRRTAVDRYDHRSDLSWSLHDRMYVRGII